MIGSDRASFVTLKLSTRTCAVDKRRFNIQKLLLEVLNSGSITSSCITAVLTVISHAATLMFHLIVLLEEKEKQTDR